MISLRREAAQTIIVGPVLDSSGAAVTSYSSLSDFRISKNGTTGSFDGSATITHRHNGYYAIALTANDTDTAGWLQITLNHASNTMARVDCYVNQIDLYSAIGYIGDQHTRANLEIVGQYTVTSGNTGWVVVGGQSGPLSPEGFLDGHLMVVARGGDRRQARWIRAHFHSGSDTGFNPDSDFTEAPQIGDVLTIYAVTRQTSNVTYWGGTSTSTATVRANLVEILGAAISGTAAWIASAFQKFFEVATPTGTVNSLPDDVPGTVGGLALHDDVAAVENTLDTLTEDSGGLRFTAKALEEAPAGGGGGDCPTVEEIAAEVDSVLTAAHGAGSWQTGGDTGSGANAVTITVRDADTSQPIIGAKVRLSEVGGALSYLAQTNDDGEAIFSLDNATWLVTITKPFYNTFEPQQLVVGGNVDAEYELERTAVDLPSDPGQSLLRVLCVDEHGEPEAGVTITAKLIAPPAGEGVAYDTATIAAVSSETGEAQAILLRGAKYEVRRGEGTRLVVTMPDAPEALVANFAG